MALHLAAAGAAEEDERIAQAIERGVEYLKSQQHRDGTWPFEEKRVGRRRLTPPAPSSSWARVGPTALAGLTLLECGTPPNDPVVQKAADVVRPGSIDLTHTYSLSTSILFLDRLGGPGDSALIQSMAVRLLAGQNGSGGWGYDCPAISKEETRRLQTGLGQTQDRRPKRPAARSTDRGPADSGSLPPEIQKQLAKINPIRVGAEYSDNSNTKFATLALWVARRHGVPVEGALRLVEKRFRTSQHADGGWGYWLSGAMPSGGGAPAGRGQRREGRGMNESARSMTESLGSMTCAGLLGLAVGEGSARETAYRTDKRAAPTRPAPRTAARDDPQIRAGLSLLASVIGQPLFDGGRDGIQLFNLKGDHYYFLWALERVAVAYGLETINGKDWYAWGSRFMLDRQGRDGGWQGSYEGSVDTCFALLFLRKANLSKDLSAILKSGGIGAEGLQSKETKSTPPREAKAAPKPAQPSSPPPTKEEPARGSGLPAEKAASKPGPPAEPPAPTGDLDADAARLSDQLVKAPTSRQGEMLEQFKEGKGVRYTQALAAAIPQLSGAVKAKARDALAERLARMTASTLRARLKDDDPEVRRASALACAMKEDLTHVPDLIAMLKDRDAHVVRAAHTALKSLTSKDFGPADGASSEDRARSMAAWKSWWEQQERK
jgi:hypothetical protein